MVPANLCKFMELYGKGTFMKNVQIQGGDEDHEIHTLLSKNLDIIW